MDKDLIGKVIHYYDKIGVAIVQLKKTIKIGDKLKFTKGNNSFDQIVDSMQIEHQLINEGKTGQEIGIKVNQQALEGTLVYPA